MKKIARTHFPATVVNARIAESISVFYESMEDFFKKKGWKWVPQKRTGDKSIQEDYSVEIKGKYKDGAYRDILFTMKRTPGLVGQSANRKQLNMSNVIANQQMDERLKDHGVFCVECGVEMYPLEYIGPEGVCDDCADAIALKVLLEVRDDDHRARKLAFDREWVA